MFEVTRTQEIKISKGDDSGTFELAINLGTNYEPMLYEFVNAFSIYSQPDNLYVNLNKQKFKSTAKEDGMYIFEYNYKYDSYGEKIGDLGWYLNGEEVLLINWGIYTTGIPKVADKIVISFYIKHISEVYFSVFDIHDRFNQYYFQKIYRNDGKVITNTACGNGYSTIKNNNDVIKDGNILLRIEPDDTNIINPGEYRYQIKVKLYDRSNNDYIINTLTHPTAFYVMD